MQVAQPVPDFNDDGFGDLAVGLPGEDVGRLPNAGAVSVLYGRANGMRSDRRVITQNSPGVPGFAEAGDQFGPPWSPAGSTGTPTGTSPSAPPGRTWAATVTPGRSPSCSAPGPASAVPAPGC
jgi:FG-GAP repeat